MKFKVMVRLDTAPMVTVEIKKTAGGTDAVVSVRPKHSRRVYTGMLSDVALIVAARDAKAALAAQGVPVPMARKSRRVK